MKKSVFILAMLLMAATAFSQTSRRTANSQKPAREKQAKSTEVKSHRAGKDNPVVRKNSNAQSNTIQRQTVRRADASSVSSGTRGVRQEVRQDHHSQNVHREAGHVTHYQSPRLYHGTRVARYHYNRAPGSRLYRTRHYPYRIPGHIEIFWTPAMRSEYIRIYPMVHTWRYPVGYRIQTISAYDALFYHGEVMNVYGKVYEVFYSRQTDEYILYFGAYYPYHDMSVVVPGWIARRMSRRPERFFERQHITVTGLITTFEEKPEIVVRNTGQLRIY
ncbi:MAG: hypothetical protein JW723_05415 [Bacteroidales bacterium]|nr:hypothetical protein [Bacteroidales bacterium]